MKTCILILAALLSGCAILPDAINTSTGLSITNPVIVKDLQSAAYNLDSAMAIGVLDANDPAPACLHDVLRKAGIETAPGALATKSFETKKDGAASAGAIIYIEVQKAKKAKPLEVSVDCEALVGRIVIDGAKAAGRALPSVLR